MSAPNPQLHEYVTRVGFQLSLTRPQILFLAIAANPDLYRPLRPLLASYVSTGRALAAKGLVLYGQPGGPQLTTAGQLVVGLLKEAGIWTDELAPAGAA